MSKLTNQWIELFRAGDHGKEKGGVFTDADLDQIVANYKPDTGHEAPATIGHIEKDAPEAPAYAWWGEVKRIGSSLWGRMREAQPEFEEMLEKKLFKKRSVGLVKVDNGWGLHHVAFLGASAPHIKGLADIKFEQRSTPVVEIEFQENQMANENQTEGFIARMDAWFKEHFPARQTAAIDPTPSATFSEADVRRFAAEAVNAAVIAAVTPLQAKLDAQTTQFSERDKQLVTTETTARAAAAIARVKASGRWVPAFDKMGLGVVFSELAKTTELVEFGEGDAKKKLTPLETLTVFMEQLQKIVPAGADIYAGHVTKPATGIKFSEADHSAQPNSVVLANLALEMQVKDKITYGEAMGRVLAARPELAIPGGASAGAV